MSDSKPGLFSLVTIPAVLTLVVTVVRLIGELQGWDPKYFGTEAGGGSAVVGITWLVPLFGFWFGWRLRRSSGGPASGKAALFYVVAVIVLAGGMFGLLQGGLVVFPKPEAPGGLVGMPYLLALMGIAALVALAAWPRLTGTLMLYGVLARLPVVVITYLDVQNGWQTHYGELPPGVVTDDPFLALSMAQVTFWPFVFTPLAGGLLGCLGAALAGSKRG